MIVTLSVRSSMSTSLPVENRHQRSRFHRVRLAAPGSTRENDGTMTSGRAAEPSPAIRLRSVRRVFPGGVEALAGLDLDVAAGELVALLGPSGCGKSTLLRLVAGLDRPQGGEVAVGGRGAAAHPGVSYVFQDAHLLPWRTVLANVALPLELAGVPRDARTAAARTAIAQVGLADAATRLPAALSGGMRMRVSIARALVTGPRVLLLDEPFAALDELTRHRLDEQLRELWLASGMTVLFVTHSIGEAAFLAERVIVLSPRPARVHAEVRVGLPERRDALLRTAPEFVELTRTLGAALAAGGA
jgi:NitT/TauT family transport system ATP-binding protein